MREALLIIDVLAALGIIGLVLLQQGKGADMGSGFGAGASQTLFGARGSANFLTRATAVLATVFFACNIGLAWIATQETKLGPSSVIERVQTSQPDTSAPTDTPPATVEIPVPTSPEVPK